MLTSGTGTRAQRIAFDGDQVVVSCHGPDGPFGAGPQRTFRARTRRQDSLRTRAQCGYSTITTSLTGSADTVGA